MLRLKFVA